VAVAPGVVIGVIGLMPRFPSSVEPSGIAPLPVADPATEPGVDGIVPEAVPPAGEVPPQALDVADAPLIPLIPLIAPLDVDEPACMLLRPPPSKPEVEVEVEVEPETLVPDMV
jgi:hypothetical protein